MIMVFLVCHFCFVSLCGREDEKCCERLISFFISWHWHVDDTD